mmetsp:Transcript_46894/g.87379  ORF Transcript_46894/g.87379 Transcript_46894/m.87379 type:complete len:487 (-) Transcript_46894:251-1711(-)
MSDDEDMQWLYEAVIRYLQGPMYSTPLMGFIDEACVIFDNDEENKLEYTKIHQDFQKLVDTLISDYLSELGVPPQKFAEIMAKSVNMEMNNFVLTSILTVDDFCQFKAMMVKRNMDLTNEVLKSVSIKSGQVASEEKKPAAATPAASGPQEEEEMDEVLAEVLRMSREQFKLESASMSMSEGDQSAEMEMDDELARVMKESMQDATAMILDNERAELEQAIQLSMQLEKEQQRLIAEEAVTRASSSKALPLPRPQAAAPTSGGASQPDASVTQSAQPLNVGADTFAKKSVLPDIAPVPSKNSNAEAAAFPPLAGDAVPVSAADAPNLSNISGYTSKGYSGLEDSPPEDRAALRQAAAAAARAQHQALQQKKERVIAKQRALKESHDPPCEQDVKMRDDYLTKQRNNLIAKKKAQREKELDSFKSTNDEFEQMINRNKGAKASATPQDSDNVESARDQLRQDLARKLKQELMHKSLSRLDGIKPKAV